jgi:Family of unknown function (DUF5989)
MTMLRGMFGTIRELMVLLWVGRRWWLIPAVLVLLIFGAIIVLGSVGGVGPFIYTLF